MSNKYNGSYPKAWSARDIATFEALGKEPAKTSNGLWVGDSEREAKALADWSLAELFALANNELLTNHSAGGEDFYKALRGKALLEHRDALSWGEDDLYNWLMYEKTPAKSPGGYFINDPDRWVKDASAWNDSELVDLGLGYFGELEKAHEYILDEACERFDLPMGITFEDYKAYLTSKALPELTSTGVLANDRHRSRKSIAEWSEAELKAYALGELEPDSTDKALLARALEQFGGEWYWDRLSLMVWVGDGEIPEFVHDFDNYTEDQLKRLVRDEDLVGAYDCLASYHLAELEDWWSHEQRRAYLLDGLIPEPPVEDEPEDEPEIEEEAPPEPDAAGTPEHDTAVISAEPEVLADPVVPEPVDEVGPVPETVTASWTDVVSEDSPLYEAMAVSTSEAIIADAERRRFLNASKWNIAELVGWARGLIAPGMNCTETTLVAALRASCAGIKANWTDDAVKQFVGLKTLPEGFEQGMLVEDALRDRKHPGDWTDEELKAYAAGRIRSKVDHASIVFSLRVRLKVPDRLSESEALAFAVDGTLPIDEVPAIVAGRPVSNRQLDAWLNGELAIDASIDEADLFAAARSRYGINVRWTDAQILAHYRNGTEPQMTASGLQVEDRLRDSTSVLNWTWKELRGLALGEIEADFSLTEPAAQERIRRLIDVQFGLSPAHWSDDEVVAYLADQTTPKALENGVYINDPTREKKQAIEWRDVELKAWLRGEIKATRSANEEQLWDELYSRFRVPLFWYREDAKSYVLDRKMVPSTLSGIWVRDRNRDARKVEHWTRRELKAWCRGQILPGINTSSDALLKQAAKLFGVSLLLDASTIKKRISDITEESMTMTVRFVTEDLASYEKGRTDAGDNAGKAAPYQSLLDRCIGRVLRLDGEDFVQGWTELLNFFHKHSTGICSARKIYVGVGQMAITPKGLRNFQNMTSVLTNTADPANRDRTVKMIDWTTALKEISNEKARQHILSYYGQ